MQHLKQSVLKSKIPQLMKLNNAEIIASPDMEPSASLVDRLNKEMQLKLAVIHLVLFIRKYQAKDREVIELMPTYKNILVDLKAQNEKKRKTLMSLPLKFDDEDSELKKLQEKVRKL